MALHSPEELAAHRDVVIPKEWNGGAGNAVGTPGGAYGFQMQLARFLGGIHPGQHGTIDADHVSNLSSTEPVIDIPWNPGWDHITSFHPLGHRAAVDHADLLNDGVRFLPTIAITRSRFLHVGVANQKMAGRIRADGKILHEDGTYEVTDINVDPVWNIDLVAKRLKVSTEEFRKLIAEHTGVQLSEDTPYFMPPIDGPNIHIFGNPALLSEKGTEVGARSHDYCRDGDNGAQRCTCYAGKQYAIEELIRIAQAGGVGILALNPEEGRNFGSVVKHLVYNRRERQEGGDKPEGYFAATHDVIGGDDARMHWTKSDVMRWLLPHAKIHHWFSESPHKRQYLEDASIEIVHQYELPADRIPALAHVEMSAKRGNGYHGTSRTETV